MALREKLYAEGLRTRSGSQLSKSRLADIFNDPFYYGAIRWKEVVYGNGQHKPLVSRELWDKVQNILNGKTTPHYKRHVFQFTKLMRCKCGALASGYVSKDGVRYEVKNHKKSCEMKGTIHEDKVEEQLVGVFRFFEELTSKEAEQIYAKIRADHQGEAEYKENALKTLQARYNALQRQLDILYDDRLGEKISQERWEAKQKTINEEQKSIQDEVARIKQEETKYFELYINILDLARRAREIYEKRTPEQRRLLLQHIFSNLMLKDKKVAYSLKQPVQRLAARVQQRLDAKKKFELSKDGSTHGKSRRSDPQINSWLRG